MNCNHTNLLVQFNVDVVPVLLYFVTLSVKALFALWPLFVGDKATLLCLLRH